MVFFNYWLCFFRTYIIFNVEDLIMAKKNKKELKKFDVEEIIARIDNFLNVQLLDDQSKYFIHKVMMDRSWDNIRPDENDYLSDFYKDEDYVDESESVVDSNDEDSFDDDEDSLDNCLDVNDDDDDSFDVDKELDSIDDSEPLNVDDLMNVVEDENKQSLEQEELLKKKKGKKVAK